MTTAARVVQSFYVHVPFCAHKCEYCAFFSTIPARGQIDQYVHALIEELRIVQPQLNPRTIYFGGGTPSLLRDRDWRQILQAMERLNLLGAEEFSVECNPATVTLEKARLLRSFGVNRVSMGVQSFDEDLLGRLGRIHNRKQIFASFNLLRRAGFANINLDLMFAIPGQTLDDWRQGLAEAVAMGGEHLSSYEVIYEEDTPLFEQLKAGRADVDEDLVCAMYDELVDFSGSRGFQQYEIANFARHQPDGAQGIPAYACRHNVNYWRGGSFLGLGPSASSFVDNVRTRNFASTPIYCQRLAQGRRAIESVDELTPLKRAAEIAGFGLRMNAGWGFAEFQRITGHDLRQEWAADMERLISLEYGLRDEHGFRLTRKGLRFADWAVELFLR